MKAVLTMEKIRDFPLRFFSEGHVNFVQCRGENQVSLKERKLL